jgi:hypothetical protein
VVTRGDAQLGPVLRGTEVGLGREIGYAGKAVNRIGRSLGPADPENYSLLLCVVLLIKHTSVVKLRYRPEPLLSGSVPYLQSHSSGRVDVHHSLGQERCTYGRSGCRGGEGISNIAMDQRSLAHALAA